MTKAPAKTSFPARLEAFLNRHRRILAPLFFMGGFAWDSLTLNRIDAWFDNLFLLGYLIALGAMISIVLLTERGLVRRPFLRKYQSWYPLLIQFLLGGLFSAYVVFYFKSTSALSSYVFLSVLVLMLIANEFIDRHILHVQLLLPLYFLACFSFFIFFIPVVLRTMNMYTFMVSGMLSLAVVGIITLYFLHRSVDETRLQFVRTGYLIAACYVLMHLFYFLNWIPPVPLSLTEGGVYHHITKYGEAGVYELQYEPAERYQFWHDTSPIFHWVPGSKVYCFAAVFAPTDLEKEVYHHWQFYDPETEEWQTTDRIPYTLMGGRDGGYRSYSFKNNIHPGIWRVDVKTNTDRTVGRIDFKIVETAEAPELDTRRL